MPLGVRPSTKDGGWVNGVNWGNAAGVTTGATRPLSSAGVRLLAAFDEHHDFARRALEPDSGPAISGVAWLSSHLAAVEHTIHRRASLNADVRASVRRDRATVRALKRWLRLLERQLAGDSTAPDGPARSAENIARLLAAHTRDELTIVQALDQAMDEEEMLGVLAAYVHAVERGPTRPHAHGTHAGHFEPAVFALNSAWDRVLDVLDARIVPIPRHRRQPARVGRWGRYLIGVNDETDFDTEPHHRHLRRHGHDHAGPVGGAQ